MNRRILSAIFAALFLLPAALEAQPAPEAEPQRGDTPPQADGGLNIAAGNGPDNSAAVYPNVENVFGWDRAQRLLGFKSVEKITAVNTVESGPNVRPLNPPAPGYAALAAKMNKLADEFMKTGDIVGVMVVHKNQVLVEKYAHGFTAEDRWTSFSVAKSITGTLTGAAVGDGALNIDDPVVKFVPELKGSAYDGVTVRHLLTMTSGVEWNETYLDPESDTARLTLGAGSGDRDPLADLAALPREAEPGARFSYKTGESNLLGLVVSRAVDKPLARYFSEKIWQPCGMESPAYWAVDSKGREMAGCCLSMTLRDYTRFGLFILDGGSGVLPENWLKEATTPVMGHKYGYQWHLVDDGIFAATGIYGQMIAIDGPTDSVAVILSAWPAPLSAKGNEQRFGFLFKLRGLLTLAGKKTDGKL